MYKIEKVRHTRCILVAAAAAAAATCYRPAGDQPCSIACDQQNLCPGEMSCISGRCHAQGDLSCAPVDAPSQIDVPSGSSGSASYGSGDQPQCFLAPPPDWPVPLAQLSAPATITP